LQAEDVTALPPALGMMVKTEQGRELIKFVEYHSPAQQAGIDAGDELLAIDGLRVTADQLGDRLKHYQPDDVIELTIFHQDELRTCLVKLSTPSPTRYQLVAVSNPSLSQQQQFSGWLNVTIASIK
jgi:predicted metalloprotease with PDZ domain